MLMWKLFTSPFSKTSSEWKECFRLFDVPLIDGTKGCGYLMRRRVKGRMQYRCETDSETLERENASWV